MFDGSQQVVPLVALQFSRLQTSLEAEDLFQALKGVKKVSEGAPDKKGLHSGVQ
jgi:hypothetical protein